MSKLKPYLFFFEILLVGLLLGVFKVQNGQQISIDTLFGRQPFGMALGDALVTAFVMGFLVGIILMLVHFFIQRVETRKLARQVRQLEKQLEKARQQKG